jgi:hypothetical protein
MSKMSAWLKSLSGLAILAGFGVLALTGCDGPRPPSTKPVEIELPFKTVLKVPEVPVSFAGTKKRATHQDLDLRIATDQTEAREIADTLLSADYEKDLLDALLSVDYEKDLVIVADWGYKPSTRWEITIEEVTQAGRSVGVSVRLVEPTVGGTLITHPVHAVKVKKADLTARGQLTFVLMEGGQAILRREYSVP